MNVETTVGFVVAIVILGLQVLNRKYPVTTRVKQVVAGLVGLGVTLAFIRLDVFPPLPEVSWTPETTETFFREWFGWVVVTTETVIFPLIGSAVTLYKVVLQKLDEKFPTFKNFFKKLFV